MHPCSAIRVRIAMVVVGTLLAVCLGNAPAQVRSPAPLRVLVLKPQVTRVQPAAMRQGQTLDLQLTGARLRDGLQVDLGAGIETGPTRGTDARGERGAVAVKVAPDAAPGRRQLVLVEQGARLPQSAWLEVQAASGVGTLPLLPGVRPIAPPQPEVTAVTPDRLLAGRDYMLRIAVKGLPPGTVFDFGPGVQALGSSTAAGSDLALTVRVDAGAPAGSRVVGFRVVPAANAIAATTPVSGRGPAKINVDPVPGTTAVAPPPVGVPAAAPAAVLESVQPTRVRAGSQVQLVFTGQGLKQGVAIDYGAGIRIAGLRPLDDRRLVGLAQIDGGASAGPRLPRATQGTGVGVQVRAGAMLQVIGKPQASNPAGSATPALPPVRLGSGLRVEGIFPSRLDGGQSYTGKLTGQGFTTGMQLEVGPGIAVDKLDVIDAHNARVQLSVAGAANPGMRFAKARADARQPWLPQPARVLVQPLMKPASGALPAPKWYPFQEIFQEGVIVLQSPTWHSPKVDNRSYEDVPTLQDTTTFEWREQNPGLADSFEIRFYRGDSVVLSRKIPQAAGAGGKPALPAFLAADPALVAELTRARAGTPIAAADTPSAVQPMGVGNASGSKTPALPGHDLTWEVVGYRTYWKDGVNAQAAARVGASAMLASLGNAGAGSAMKAAAATAHVPIMKQVEHSERWPLNLPGAPTGMLCGREAKGQSTLHAYNLDNQAGAKDKSGSTNQVATANHTGDRWQLRGSMTLARSPWASKPEQTRTRDTTTWRFDNVFIDWGDGTVEPLEHTRQGGYGSGGLGLVTPYGNGDGIDFDAATNGGSFRHAYRQIGHFTVRVYQLSEDDLQDHAPAEVSLAANPGMSLYAVAQRLAGGSGDDGTTRAAGFRRGQAVADRAYMLMCQTVEIQSRSDDASSGPLNLVAAKLRGFPSAPGDAAPPAGVKVAPKVAPGQLMPLDAAKARGPMAMKAGLQPARGSETPAFSACDVDLAGGGYLYYYGTGAVRMTWYVDGVKVDSNDALELPPSASRPDAVLASKDPGPPLISATGLLLSHPIPLKPLGGHTLSFDAEVLPRIAHLQHLDVLMGRALGSGGLKPDARLASQLAAGLVGAPPIGVLPPQGIPGLARPPVVWLGEPLRTLAAIGERATMVAMADPPLRAITAGPAVNLNRVLSGFAPVAGKHEPPVWVASNRLRYQVVNAHEGVACTFEFPVQGGSFTVNGLQDAATGQSHVKRQGDRWSGTGKLRLPLPDGSVVPVPISFSDWRIGTDGVTVQSGTLDVAHPLDWTLDLQAVSAALARLQGTAGQRITLDLEAGLKNPNIRVAGTDRGPQPLKVRQAVLSPKGDLYAGNLDLPDLDVYDSGFHLRGIKAALDLSASEGSACRKGNAFTGLVFSAATLDAFHFDIGARPVAPVQDWGIDGAGFCGKQSFGAFDARYMKGSLHWDGIDASAQNGAFSASYRGVRTHIPWLDVDLHADGAMPLSSGAGAKGGGHVTLNLQGDAPRRDFGAVSMDADGLALMTTEGVGLTAKVQTTRFSFRADGRDFATDVAIPDLLFGLDGKAYFNQGGGSAHADLGGRKGRLSQSVIDLKGLDVTAVAAAGGTQRLQFGFAGTLRISDQLPAADVPVSFRIDEPSDGRYVGTGPVTGTFTLHKTFPDAQPVIDLAIRPAYAGDKNGGMADAGVLPALLDMLVAPAHAAGSRMVYCGETDIGMFGGPPVKGDFALGYQGSDDFWAAHADLKLGPAGAPLVAPFMQLYEIGGGLGYNVALSSFAGAGGMCSVAAAIDRTPVFDAHMVVGSPDHFGYGMDGHFTVKTSGTDAGARMTYKAWLLRSGWGGEGDFHGYFQYAGGSFDGTLNGGYSFLGDNVSIRADNDAIAVHFGNGSWYIHAGTRDNPVQGHVLFADAGAWLGIGNEGLYAGARGHLGASAGSCGGVCASASADALVEAAITPQPHLAADADVDLNAHACAFDICIGSGVGAGMHMAALPAELSVSFRLGGCPPGHLDVGLQILPNPSPRIGGGVCLW